MNIMPAIRKLLVLILLVTFGGCSDDERVKSTHQVTVEVSQNLPVSLRNAVLNLHVRDPIDTLVTNCQSWGGNYNLNYPAGSGLVMEGTNQFFEENRLLAIKPEGFEVLFTKRENDAVQTNCVLFRYGEVTQTNTLGWTIVGKFK